MSGKEKIEIESSCERVSVKWDYLSCSTTEKKFVASKNTYKMGSVRVPKCKKQNGKIWYEW